MFRYMPHHTSEVKLLDRRRGYKVIDIFFMALKKYKSVIQWSKARKNLN